MSELVSTYPTYLWKEFLTDWNREVLGWDEFIEDFKMGEALFYAEEHFDVSIVDKLPTEWLGYPGATEVQLAQAEARLGITFPPSYRQFLVVSNGWRGLTTEVDHLYSTDEVDWLRVREQHMIDLALKYGINDCTDDEYLAYDENGADIHECCRSRYVPTALQISTRKWGLGDIWLLNPQVVSADGEWEAWHDTGCAYGPFRYQSFWAMVQAKCKRHREYVEQKRREDQ